ncbi:hypothetical protein HDU76_008367, partial [Blyttiomyces sp. JEL0837]
MTIHAWKGYKDFAWGHDELSPSSKQPHDWHPPLILLHTPIDSLDTLFIMNLTTEYTEAKNLILDTLDFNVITESVNFFETVIRIVGGLLSAYELDGDQRLLDKVVDLADRLMLAFDEDTGVKKPQPYARYSLAEVGSNQLEFQYLTDLTGNQTYAQKSLFIYEKLFKMKKPIPGLFPTFFQNSAQDLMTADQEYTLGGNADSFYEYLLKMYLATGEQHYFDVYSESAE